MILKLISHVHLTTTVLVSCLFFSVQSHALNLRELQQAAINNREIIARYKANLQQSAYSVKGAWSAYLPSLDVSYNMVDLKIPSSYEKKQSGIVTGIININLFSGFKDKYNIISSQLLQKAAAHKLEGIKQDIMLNVALHYLSIYYNRSNYQVALDSFNTITKAYEYENQRFNIGLSQKKDLLQFKVDLDNASIDLKKAAIEEKKSIRLLQREIQANAESITLKFAEFHTLPPKLSQEKYSKTMLENRSEIKVYLEQIQAAEAQVKMFTADHYPSVNLSSSYQSGNDNLLSDNSYANEDEFRTNLILSMNIFNGFETDSKVNIAKLAVQSLRYDFAELKADLKSELDNFFLDYDVAVENANIAKNSIIQAQENLRVNRDSYNEGLTTESDLLIAITKLSRARFNFVAAKSEAFDTYYRILRDVEKFDTGQE